MVDFYGSDLARIHAIAFERMAEAAATEVLLHLGHRAAGARVLDLGCGSGALAAVLTRAGAKVWGADISPAFLAIARRRVPDAEFVLGSMHELALPPAQAVCAIGEVVNYLADPRAGETSLASFLARAARALPPGGLLLFDAAAPGRMTGGGPGFTAGDGWAVRTISQESEGILSRNISTFLQDDAGVWWPRREVHRLTLFPRKMVLDQLAAGGFDALAEASYGALRLPPGLIVYRAVRRA